MVRDAETIRRWYILLENLLNSLCKADGTHSQIFWFELTLLGYGGVFFNPSICPVCDIQFEDNSKIVFDERDGVFMHEFHCEALEYLTIDSAVHKIIKMLTAVNFNDSVKIKPSLKQIELMSALFLRLLSVHFGKVPSVRQSLFCHLQDTFLK